MNKPKFIITGHSQHGKDTACKVFEKFGFTWASSSEVANPLIVYPTLKDLYGYKSPEECFNDRHNRMEEWFNIIKEFNNPLDRLGSIIFKSHDIYCGIRNHEELKALKKVVSIAAVIWIDASERKPPQPSSSMTVTAEMCDIIITNNGTEKQLESSIIKLLF